MSVWVVGSGTPGEDYAIHGLFATDEAAVRFADECNSNDVRDDPYYVQEMTVSGWGDRMNGAV